MSTSLREVPKVILLEGGGARLGAWVCLTPAVMLSAAKTELREDTLPPCCELGSYGSQEGAGCLMATSCRGVTKAQNIPGMARYRGGRGLTTVF